MRISIFAGSDGAPGHADYHPLFVEALEVALTNAGPEVVGTAGDGAALLGLIEQTDAGVASINLEMAGMGDSDCLRELRRKILHLKVILLSGHTGGRCT